MNLTELPNDLPVPLDDGRCTHLLGKGIPSIPLQATSGRWVDLSEMPGRVVIYFYPMTGRPGVALPDGWDSIPGARGCTPQSCSFRDHYHELNASGTTVFGVSTQDMNYQREAAERLHLPFELLSDAERHLTNALALPTFEIDGQTLIKRITLIAYDQKIVKVFYPVFPPNQNAEDVIAWIKGEHWANPR